LPSWLLGPGHIGLALSLEWRQCITHASKLFRPLRPFRINSFSLGKLAPVFQKTVFLLACAVLLRRADGRAYVGDYGSIEEVLCATAVIWLAYLVTVFVLGRLVARQIQSHCHPQLGGVSPVRRAFPRTEQFVSTADDPQARSPPFRGIGRPAEGFARFFSKVCLSAVLKFFQTAAAGTPGDRHRVKVRSDRRFPAR
jgi:hypothetical protein